MGAIGPWDILTSEFGEQKGKKPIFLSLRLQLGRVRSQEREMLPSAGHFLCSSIKIRVVKLLFKALLQRVAKVAKEELQTQDGQGCIN